MLQRVLLKTCKKTTDVFRLQYQVVSSASTATNKLDSFDSQLEQVHIDEAVKIKPSLAAVSPELWRRAHATLLNHGLQTTNFLQIAVGNPTILTRSPQKIIECLEYWRSCQFGEKLLHLLITKYPELLNVSDGHSLLVHIGYLKSVATTTKNVWKLLMTSPDLLEQSEEQIEAKLVYLKQRMHIEIPEVVKSAALSQPLEEIRCRHVFLERLGLFKPRPLKTDPNEPSSNNRLYQITDTSEKTFATKICHVSLVEYEAFKELFAREQNHKSNKQKEETNDEFSDED